MSVPVFDLRTLLAQGVLGELDLHFAEAMARLASERDPRVLLATALVSRQVQAGHVCLDLPGLCRGELGFEGTTPGHAAGLPDLDAWLAALRNSALTGPEQADTPLYLDTGGRLYLRRYLEHERNVATSLRSRAALRALPVDSRRLRNGLDRLFGGRPPVAAGQLTLFEGTSPAPGGDEPDLQRVAAERAVLRNLCVISGGPGTGKTSTVVKILALLVDQALARGVPAPRTHLLAPTGKAAARLSEAIRDAKAELPLSAELRRAIPEQASTIHRALGAIPGSPRFRHDHETPLATDIVVVDEASMVDLSLMSRLLDAIPLRARTILLGDKNQLASVEAGAVLGDICGAGATTSRPGEAPIAGCIVHLTRSYRYREHSGIQRLADAINRADAATVLRLLRDPELPDVTLIDTSEPAALERHLLPAALDHFTAFFDATDPAAKLDALNHFRILCAHRHGAQGQVTVNAALEAAAREARRITPRGERYPGRPILVTQNDPHTRLFNGDVGVLVQAPQQGARLDACFRGPDGQLRQLSAARLPPHESVYAMSIHKSQGSEFDRVAIVLPCEASPVLSRELLYTAVTRARQAVTIYAPAPLVELAIQRAVQRASGLREQLW